MKKILSIALAAVMLLSIIPTAFAAENNWQGGTKVEYTATANEQYTVTVPATLAPGASGDVVASGTWGSNRKLTVTADKDVTLTNSINAADQKVLDVTFAGIELTGSNTESVSDTKQVAVANITDAIFGTWSGTFNYNVAMSDVAGGTETPTPDPEQPADPDNGGALVPGEGQFVFTIDGKEYLADDGMSWGAWCLSEYNTEGFKVTGSQYIANDDYIYIYTNNGSFVANSLPILSTIAYTSGPRVIRIIVAGNEYQAEEGMTWKQFVDSEYNTDAFYIKNNSVVCEYLPDEYQYKWIADATPDDQIVAANNYGTVKGGNPA